MKTKHKAYSTLAYIASNLAKQNFPLGATDGGIAICELMSKQFGTELTIEEGSLISDFLSIIQYNEKRKFGSA